MDAITGIDRALFYLANTRLTTAFLDFFMPFITTKSNFIEVLFFLWAMFMIMGTWKTRRILLLLLFVVAISDYLSSSIFKEYFQRIRPCSELEGVRLLVGCGGSYSFPSSHSTNIFAAMVWLSLHYRRLTPLFLAIAVLVAYSRVYVGVHYPLDIVGGACLGTSVALLSLVVESKAIPLLTRHRREGEGGN